MSIYERIMIECRYLLSLNKDYVDLANLLNISVSDVFDDLNVKLPNIDTELSKRVNKVLKERKCL